MISGHNKIRPSGAAASYKMASPQRRHVVQRNHADFRHRRSSIDDRTWFTIPPENESPNLDTLLEKIEDLGEVKSEKDAKLKQFAIGQFIHAARAEINEISSQAITPIAEQDENRAVLQEYCSKFNEIVQTVIDSLSDSMDIAVVLGNLDSFFTGFLNSDAFAGNEDEKEVTFAKLSGHFRSPEYVNFCLQFDQDYLRQEGFQYFSPVKLNDPSVAVVKVLRNLFATIDVDLDTMPLHYNLLEFSDEKDYALQLWSSMPYIDTRAEAHMEEVFGDHQDFDELVAHEMTHAILENIGYSDGAEKSYIPKVNKYEVHELLAFAAGVQFAPIMCLFQALSYSSGVLDRTQLTRNIFKKALSEFGLDPNKIENLVSLEEFDFEPSIKEERSKFQLMLKDIGDENRIKALAAHIRKRFRQSARKMLVTLKERGAFPDLANYQSSPL